MCATYNEQSQNRFPLFGPGIFTTTICELVKALRQKYLADCNLGKASDGPRKMVAAFWPGGSTIWALPRHSSQLALRLSQHPIQQ